MKPTTKPLRDGLPVLRRFSYQGKSPRPAQIFRQFQSAIRYSGRKTLLVNAPQSLEIRLTEVSKTEFHGCIVAAKTAWARFGADPTPVSPASVKSKEPVAVLALQVVIFACRGFVGRLVLHRRDRRSSSTGGVVFLLYPIQPPKGALALRWVESACSARAESSDSHWLSITLLQARLGFAAHWFDNAKVTIRLRPRPIPFRWFVSAWHRQKETLTFEADLGAPRLPTSMCSGIAGCHKSTVM